MWFEERYKLAVFHGSSCYVAKVQVLVSPSLIFDPLLLLLASARASQPSAQTPDLPPNNQLGSRLMSCTTIPCCFPVKSVVESVLRLRAIFRRQRSGGEQSSRHRSFSPSFPWSSPLVRRLYASDINPLLCCSLNLRVVTRYSLKLLAPAST